jgi:hypothetical protein
MMSLKLRSKKKTQTLSMMSKMKILRMVIQILMSLKKFGRRS